MIEFIDAKTLRGIGWQVIRSPSQLRLSYRGELGIFDLVRRLPSPVHLPPWPAEPKMVQATVFMQRKGDWQGAVWAPSLLTEVLLASSLQILEGKRQELRRIRLAFIRNEPCLLFESILMPVLLVDQFPILFKKIVGV